MLLLDLSFFDGNLRFMWYTGPKIPPLTEAPIDVLPDRVRSGLSYDGCVDRGGIFALFDKTVIPGLGFYPAMMALPDDEQVKLLQFVSRRDRSVAGLRAEDIEPYINGLRKDTEISADASDLGRVSLLGPKRWIEHIGKVTEMDLSADVLPKDTEPIIIEGAPYSALDVLLDQTVYEGQTLRVLKPNRLLDEHGRLLSQTDRTIGYSLIPLAGEVYVERIESYFKMPENALVLCTELHSRSTMTKVVKFLGLKGSTPWTAVNTRKPRKLDA